MGPFVVVCPYCVGCDEACGRESFVAPAPDGSARSIEVYAAVMDLYSTDRTVLDTDPLYVAQDLVFFGHFPENDPPSLTHVGHAQDLIRAVER